MPVYDANLLSINAAVTASKNGDAITLRGSGVHGLTMRFYIPSTTGTTNDILPKVEASNDNSTYTEISRYPDGAQSWASGAKHFLVPFATSKKYVRAVTTVSGSTGTPNFGTVVAGVVPRAHADWDRSVDFS